MIGDAGLPCLAAQLADEAGLEGVRQSTCWVLCPCSSLWSAGLPFDLLIVPTVDPAPIDIRAALELDQQLYDRAQRWTE